VLRATASAWKSPQSSETVTSSPTSSLKNGETVALSRREAASRYLPEHQPCSALNAKVTKSPLSSVPTARNGERFPRAPSCSPSSSSSASLQSARQVSHSPSRGELPSPAPGVTRSGYSLPVEFRSMPAGSPVHTLGPGLERLAWVELVAQVAEAGLERGQNCCRLPLKRHSVGRGIKPSRRRCREDRY